MPDDLNKQMQQDTTGFALRVYHAQKSITDQKIAEIKEAEKNLNRKKADTAITSSLVVEQIGRSIAMGIIVAADQLSRFNTALTPIKDTLITNSGYAAVAFSALLTLISFAKLIHVAVKAKKSGDKNAIKKHLLSEDGLKQMIPAILGCIAGGVMIAMASVPIAVVIAGGVSFAIQQISDIIFRLAKITEAQKELKTLKSQFNKESNLEKMDLLSSKIKGIKKHIQRHAQKLGISTGLLIAGSVAFSLLAGGLPTLNVPMLAAGAIIMVVLAIFSLTMMSIGIHKKRMAHQKEKVTLLNAKRNVDAESPEEKNNPMSPQEKKQVHAGVLGMAKEARLHASKVVHHNDENQKPPRNTYCSQVRYQATQGFQPHYPSQHNKTIPHGKPTLNRQAGTRHIRPCGTNLNTTTPKRMRPRALSEASRKAQSPLFFPGYNQRVNHLRSCSLSANGEKTLNQEMAPNEWSVTPTRLV